MDYQNEKHALPSITLENLADFPIKVGAKQLRKALISGIVLAVFLAEDADPAITEPLMERCAAQKIPVRWVKSMEELGLACRIEVKAAAAAAVQK